MTTYDRAWFERHRDELTAEDRASLDAFAHCHRFSTRDLDDTEHAIAGHEHGEWTTTGRPVSQSDRAVRLLLWCLVLPVSLAGTAILVWSALELLQRLIDLIR